MSHKELCECGREKDIRSLKCSICSGISFGKNTTNEEREEELKNKILENVKQCDSYLELSKKIKTSRHYVNRIIKNENINIDHFKPACGRCYTAEQLLIKSDKEKHSTVRKFIMRENLLNYVCSECGLEPFWNGTSLSMELHHLNGDPTDNRIENLKFLCPNCHSQTKTYKGRNIKS